MGKGGLVAAKACRGLIKSAFAHLGAERAGVWLFADIENHLGNIRLFHMIGDADALQKIPDGRGIKAIKAEIDRYAKELVVDFHIAAVERQRVEQEDGILATRDTHGNLIAAFYHIKFFAGPAQAPKHFLHMEIPFIRGSFRQIEMPDAMFLLNFSIICLFALCKPATL